MGRITLSDAPRILIVRLSAIGDSVHTLPLAAALRRARSDAFIGWAVEAPAAALVRDNPLLNWVRVLPKGWLKRPGLVRDLRRELKEMRFDVVFDVQGLTKSAAVGWLAGSALRIGFTRGESREVAPLLDSCLVSPEGVHAVDITLSLLKAVGITPPATPEFVLPPCPPGDMTTIEAFLGQNGVKAGFMLMGPWGSFRAKLWPLERFRELAFRLRQRTGLVSIMLGHGDAERSAVAALASGTEGCLLAAPDVGLCGVVQLARRATAFVGCDSFPMHAAAAVGCQTLGLFAVTNPERLGPYGPTGHFIHERLVLPRSTRERRQLGTDAIKSLGVDAVLEKILRIVDTQDISGGGTRE